MSFQFNKIRSPDGIEHSSVISFENTPHFIASFGSEVKIFNLLLKEVFSFKTKFNISLVLSFQKYYFLIGNSSYSLYFDRTFISENTFPKPFVKIYKILLIKNSFLIIYDNQKYILGTINNYKFEFEKILTDDHYFNTLSAEVLEDKMNILVSTFSKRYLIIYSPEGLSFKSIKREIQNGNILVKRKEDFLLFDESGMWQYGNKINFIKEFANYKIASSISDEMNTFVFCENGEVILIKKDNSHSIILTLDCSIKNVSKIGNILFCTSKEYSYFIKISETVTGDRNGDMNGGMNGGMNGDMNGDRSEYRNGDRNGDRSEYRNGDRSEYRSKYRNEYRNGDRIEYRSKYNGHIKSDSFDILKRIGSSKRNMISLFLNDSSLHIQVKN